MPDAALTQLSERLMRSAFVGLLTLASACGGARAEGGTTPAGDACAPLRQEALEAEAALAACREGVAPWSHQAAFDRVLTEVRSVAALAAQGPVAPEIAQHAADAFWELLDAVSPELTNHAALDRAENAAESLLRDREGDEAVRAASEAEESLNGLRAALRPDETVAPCADAQSAAATGQSRADACATAHGP